MKKIAFIAALVSLAAFSACDYNDTNETGAAADGINASVAAAPAITVYYKANVQWISSPSVINIHFNAGSGWTTAPGKAMIKHTGQYDQWVGYASYTVEGASTLTFCFNRDGAEWDNNGGRDYRITAPGSYTVENGVITMLETKAYGDVYVAGVYPSYVLGGLPMDLYKDGAYLKTATITYTTSHGIYATFRDLPAGSYRARLDSTVDQAHYSGEASFTVASGDRYFASQTITVATDTTKAQGDVYYNPGSLIWPEYIIGGMMVKLYKDGGSRVFAEKPWNYSNTKGTSCRFTGLPAGTYRAVVNEEVDGYRYKGETAFTVTSGATYFSTAGITLSKLLVNGITLYYKNVNWVASPGNVNCHYNTGSGWTAVPGVAMVKHASQYEPWLNHASIAIEGAENLTFCFNKNGTEWDNNGGKDYRVSGKGTYVIDNGTITKID